MPPTADATLLPPPPFASDDDDELCPPTRRSLDQVGPLAVLKTMVEQRRASQPAAHEIAEVAEVYTSDADDTEELAALRSDEAEVLEQLESDLPNRPRVPANSDAFLKAR
jgi:hypothetical protein